jgi:hypothetical protein
MSVLKAMNAGIPLLREFSAHRQVQVRWLHLAKDKGFLVRRRRTSVRLGKLDLALELPKLYDQSY